MCALVCKCATKKGENGGCVHVKCSAHKHHLRSQQALKAASPYRLYTHGSKNGFEGGGGSGRYSFCEDSS